MKKRRFRVWVACNHVGASTHEEILEFDRETEPLISQDCKDCMDSIIENYFDTGWEEIDEEGKAL